MDQLCAHVILLPVKSMHTSPICCSSQADKLALCTHKQTEHFPDIRDCFQSEKQSPGSFTQKKPIHSAVFLQVTSLHYMYNYYTTQQIIKKTLSPAISNASTAKRHQQPALIFLVNQTFPFLSQLLYLIIIAISIRKSHSSEAFLRDLNIGKVPKAANFAVEVWGLFYFISRIIHLFIVLSTFPSFTHTHRESSTH